MSQPLEKVEPKVDGGRNPQIKIISAHSIFNENAVVMSQKFKWALESTFDPRVRVRDNRRVLKSEAPNLYVIWLFNS